MRHNIAINLNLDIDDDAKIFEYVEKKRQSEYGYLPVARVLRKIILDAIKREEDDEQ